MAGKAKNQKKKSFRLNQGFWHAFVPGTDLLISPQNIKLELWDLAQRKIVQKVHPNMFCLRGKPDFSLDGRFFAFRGGCEYKQSWIRIYETESFLEQAGFVVHEEVENPLFSLDGQSLYFATWEGRLYRFDRISREMEIILSIGDSFMGPMCLDPSRQSLYIPTVIRAGEGREYFYQCISIVNIPTRTIRELRLNDITPGKSPSPPILGSAFKNSGLAVLTTRHGDTADKEAAKVACLYIYDATSESLELIWEDLVLPDIFSNSSALSWSSAGLLACIGLDCVYLFDSQNDYVKTSIPFDRACSVIFSPCGSMLAVGGKKARLFFM